MLKTNAKKIKKGKIKTGTVLELPKRVPTLQERLGIKKEEITTSPVPTKKIVMLSFADALKEVVMGKHVTRVAWDNNQVYLFLNEEFIWIHNAGNENPLLVSVGDIEGIDWYVLPVAKTN